MIGYRIDGWRMIGPIGQTSPIRETSATVWEYFFGRMATTEEIKEFENAGFRVLPVISPGGC